MNTPNAINSNINNQNQCLKIPRRDIRDMNNENDKSRNSRIKSGTSAMNKTGNRDLTPSRIINSIKNIRLSNQVVVAIGDSTNMMQIQRVPVNSLL